MECKSEQKLVVTSPASLLNSLPGGSSGERQTVAKVYLGPEVATILLRAVSGSTCDNPKILGDEVLPNKVFNKN